MSLPIRTSGFTLVELSIVLVIIGLIVGGVLLGRDMILGAQIRAQIKQIDEINLAVTTFKGKYGCLPGDCRNATMFFTSAAQPDKVFNGNGDGRIWGYYTPNAALGQSYIGIYPTATQTAWGVYWEWFTAYDHLAAAGMIALGQFDEGDPNANAPGVGCPQQKLDAGTYSPNPAGTYGRNAGCITFGDEAGKHRIRLGMCYLTSWGPYVPVFGCNPPQNALIQLDTKIDDGNLLTGRAFATNTTYLYDYLLGGADNRNYCTLSYANGVSRECAWSIDAMF